MYFIVSFKMLRIISGVLLITYNFLYFEFLDNKNLLNSYMAVLLMREQLSLLLWGRLTVLVLKDQMSIVWRRRRRGYKIASFIRYQVSQRYAFPHVDVIVFELEIFTGVLIFIKRYHFKLRNDKYFLTYIVQ